MSCDSIRATALTSGSKRDGHVLAIEFDFPPEELMDALGIMGLALGMRHGTDPDHLAAIDGLTAFGRVQRMESISRSAMLWL